eukprot:15411876-Alexandrium_andersonii.AAC.1
MDGPSEPIPPPPVTPPSVALAAGVGRNLRGLSPSFTPDTPPSVRRAWEADLAAAAAAARAAPFVPAQATDVAASQLPGQLRTVPGW